jgi:hypothetical protein
MKRSWVILFLGLAAAVTVVAQPAPDVNPSLKGPNVLDYVISPNSVVFSRTFSEWDAEWQQWAYSIPVANHPLFDNGDCSVGQSGMVWFLGGKFCNNNQTCNTSSVQRNCTVPHGKYLYFPVANGEDSALEESVNEHPGDASYQQIGFLRQFEDPWASLPGTEYALVDGVLVPNIVSYSIQSPVFGFTIPDDNYLKAVYAPPNDFPAGTYYPAVDQGQYLMIAPLPAGHHVIQFGASWPSGWGFNITYFLTVKR